ncbi:MAG TPA: serine hydrolase [Bryobacteraceae bacterium]|nr:serine hydrolase [Bryobacteraceae bacterium]
MSRFCVLLLCSISLLGAQTAPLVGLDEYITHAMRTFDVPGVAVTVVHSGDVVLAKGYGVRRLGEPAPVDEHTLFGIASNSKAFTTAALAILVDEGKIKWDDPVIDHLEWFQMYDPYVTHEITIRDLLTHRSGMGLGEGDLLFFPPSSYTRDEILHKLRFMKPASSFRSRYAYDNLLYLAAGQIIPAVTGKPWEDFIRERIFRPLGMTDSNTSVADFHPGGNYATPHSQVEGKLTPVPPARIDNTAPAGAINSSVSDLAKWVALQLNKGEIPGAEKKRLFSERQSREMWSPQTILPTGEPPPALAALRTDFAAYGLGWNLREYRGHKLVGHTGGLPGYVSQVTLIPDMQLAVVVLTNQESGGMFSSVTYHILDSYMNAEAVDWVKAFHDLSELQRAAANNAEKSAASARAADSKPSLPLEKYAGRYVDPWYGDIDIALEQGKLVMRFSHTPALTGDLEHWQYDTFKARWRDRSLAADAFVTFALKPDGSIRQVNMVPASALTDFSFDFQDLLLTPAK